MNYSPLFFIVTMECPICYEAITDKTGIVITSCNHSYHFSCIAGWYIKQEKGTCPCCRKQMSKEEDFPDVGESSTDEEEEEEEEVVFTRRELQQFIRANGGNLTVQMSDAICEVVGSFTHTELNSLLVGNTGRVLTEEVWQELLNRPPTQESMSITLVDGERILDNAIYDTAATKIQNAWRTMHAAKTLMMLQKN
jgi:hypothetical protein